MYKFGMVSVWRAVLALNATLHVVRAGEHIVAVSMRVLSHGIAVRVWQPLGTHLRERLNFSQPRGSERLWSSM